MEKFEPLPVAGLPFGADQEKVPRPPVAENTADCPVSTDWLAGEQTTGGGVGDGLGLVIGVGIGEGDGVGDVITTAGTADGGGGTQETSTPCNF